MEFVLGRVDDEDQAGVWISTVEPAAAMAHAAELDARIDELDDLPLYGLILSVKDCIDVAGVPTTAACPEFSYVPTRSSHVVDKALAAGALYVGKTNMDQFATGLVGVRSPYGIARNPHNPDYIPGGSSSGAAVSIATGTSSVALGTDTGGSGRVPASYCGVTGLKPAPGALSRRGMVNACRSFDTISIYAATPLEALDALHVVAGYDEEDCFSDPQYSVARRQESAGPASEARIAVPKAQFREFFGNRETQTLFEEAVQSVSGKCSSVDGVDFAPFLAINDLMFFGPFLAERDVAVGDFLRKNPNAGEKVVRDLILKGTSFTASDAYRASYNIAETKRLLVKFWKQFDAILVPTVGTVLTIEDLERDPLTPNFGNGYYTNFANPLGLAAISVPHAVTGAGVPYGVTFLGPGESESFLVSLANEFMGSTA